MLIKKRIGRVCILLGIACVLVAAGLLLQTLWAEDYAAQASANALAAIALQTDSTTTDSTAKEDTDSAEQSATVQDITVDTTVYCGILTIETLGLTLPIQAEFSYPNLKSTPCLYPQEGYDATVIAAHNYNAHFGSLPQLSVGDCICYTPIGQDAMYYTVSELNTVDASEGSAVQGAADELILFTCNINNNTQRVVVRCTLVS